MPPNQSFQALMAKLREGEADAARRIFQHFGQRLIALARSRLRGPAQAKVDPEDVMQSVLKSFFVRHADSPFRLDSWDSLWSLLTVFTLRKCGFQTRFFRAECRDVQREQDAAASWQAIAREPTPVEAALLNEAVEQLLRGLDERDRRIVELSLQGYNVTEVAAQAKCAERTVERVLARIKYKLQRLGAEG